MKKIKLFLILSLVFFFISGSVSYSHPRYRINGVYYAKPVHCIKVVKKYHTVKKPKVHLKHHKKVIRKIIYY